MGKRYEALLSAASAHAAQTVSAFQPQSVVRISSSLLLVKCPNHTLGVLCRQGLMLEIRAYAKSMEHPCKCKLH